MFLGCIYILYVKNQTGNFEYPLTGFLQQSGHFQVSPEEFFLHASPQSSVPFQLTPNCPLTGFFQQRSRKSPYRCLPAESPLTGVLQQNFSLKVSRSRVPLTITLQQSAPLQKSPIKVPPYRSVPAKCPFTGSP